MLTMHLLLRSTTLLAALMMFALPGISGAATIFYDDFNRPNSTEVGNGWIVTEDGRWDVRIKNNRLRMRDKDGSPFVTQIGIDTTGYENITLSFDYEAFAGNGDTTETKDILSVLYDGGSGLQLLDAIELGTDGVVFSVTYSLPDSASGITDLATRLTLEVSTDEEGVFIDNFLISGDLVSTDPHSSPAPEPSAALVFGVGLLTVSTHLRRRS
jgi:hypothetical protein